MRPTSRSGSRTVLAAGLFLALSACAFSIPEANPGWIPSAGGDVPVRFFGSYDFFPKARFLYGSIIQGDGDGIRVIGAESTRDRAVGLLTMP